VEHFATLLERTELQQLRKATITEVLSRLRGVVRRQVEDEQLLLFLAYPWAWFAESMGRGLKLPFGKDRVHKMLVDLGRIGGKPTEPCVAPPFRGFSVEWMPLKGAPRPEGERKPVALATTPLAIEAPAAPVALPAVDDAVPTPQAVAWPAAPRPLAPAVPGAQLAQQAAPPRGFCKYWLPEAVFVSGQDLKELIAGPGGSHFAHVLKKYPSVELRIDGQCSTAAPPAHRIHVVMSSEDSEIFEGAAADVLDLVETVCDMVGEELGMTEEQVEGLIREIRAEKYFEAHGIRTPLPPSRPAARADPGPVASPPPLAPVAALPPIAEPAPLAPPSDPAAPAEQVPDTARETGEFEFIDEDIDMAEPAAGDADTEDDARTEASDMLSDVTEADDGKEAKAHFDDI